MRRAGPGIGLVAAAGVAVLLLWTAGLAHFVAVGQRIIPHSAAPTDAIVVLTGGSGRIESGFALLRAGKGKRLFISGVNPHVDLADLIHASRHELESVACCIVLGHHAENTRENAEETAQWMRREGYKSLRLVTSWYHMPRSLVDFTRAMPDLKIIPHPVFPPDIPADGWWARRKTLLLVIREYTKYLVALAGSLLPNDKPAVSPDRGGAMTASGR